MSQLLIPYSTHPPSYTESEDFRLRSSARLVNFQDQSWRATNTVELPMKHLGRHRDIDNPMLRTSPAEYHSTYCNKNIAGFASAAASVASRGGVEIVSLRHHHASRGVVTLSSPRPITIVQHALQH
jgi:hypothetical protein